MTAYYNEWEPYPAQWLRNLIKAGLIAPGDVDERSIKDVKPDDLRKYTQCHFFAGIGGWSYALRLAGWEDSRPVWTGSCPCQPFSVAGAHKAQADERHLWPSWYSLIRECKPPTIFGEQVSGAITHGWLDAVYKGLEAEGYAIGASVLPACSVGAPHKRDRLWFVADSRGAGRGEGMLREQGDNGEPIEQRRSTVSTEPSEAPSPMAYSESNGRRQGNKNTRGGEEGISPQQEQRFTDDGEALADAESEQARGLRQRQLSSDSCSNGIGRSEAGFWDVEPAVGRVANGILARTPKLRAYGNAIVPQVAQAFIEAFMEVRP